MIYFLLLIIRYVRLLLTVQFLLILINEKKKGHFTLLWLGGHSFRDACANICLLASFRIMWLLYALCFLCVGFSHKCRGIAMPVQLLTQKQWLRVSCANLPKLTLINLGLLVWIWNILWHLHVFLYIYILSLCLPLSLSLFMCSIHLNQKKTHTYFKISSASSFCKLIFNAASQRFWNDKIWTLHPVIQ